MGGLLKFSFIYLMGKYLLNMEEFSRIEGFVSDALNSTFITLVPKTNKPKKIVEVIPINLCNLSYKPISNIISNKIISYLSKHMSLEQFGFLHDRQILDSIGTTQEVIYYIQQKNLQALILDMDLEKSFDKVGWVFLTLILNTDWH